MKIRCWAALVAAMVVGGQAQAATVTRSYSITASKFTSFANEVPPFGSFSADLVLTYDDAVSGYFGAPTQFRVTTDGRVNDGPFAAVPAAGYFLPDGMRNTPRAVIGGALNGANVMLPFTDDFFISFDGYKPDYASVSFVTAATRAGMISLDARVRETTVPAAVPEPATWLMLVTGFGAIGAALRRRKPRLTTTALDARHAAS
jgi:hypothetical protein